MLHRKHNANRARGSYGCRYRKRVPYQLQRRVGLGDRLPFAEGHNESMAWHHLRRIGCVPSDACSGEVEAVLRQYR